MSAGIGVRLPIVMALLYEIFFSSNFARMIYNVYMYKQSIYIHYSCGPTYFPVPAFRGRVAFVMQLAFATLSSRLRTSVGMTYMIMSLAAATLNQFLVPY